MLTVEDLRSKDSKGLYEELKKLKQEQMNLRFQKASDVLENVAQMRIVRRQIARVKTVVNENLRKDK